MGFSHMKSKLSLFTISPSLFDRRITPSNISSPLQKITSRFNPQLVQSPLMNRASLTGFNLVSPMSSFVPGARRVQRIPYTNRFHYVVSDKLAKKFIEDEWDGFKQTLPKSDPRVIRVESIAGKIFEAMSKGLMLKHNALDLGASTGRKLLWKPATKHLDGKHWEVHVIDTEYTDDDYWVFDGKIVISKGLIDNCKSDAELATVIAHKIGHYVARHNGEEAMKMLLFGFLLLPSGETSIVGFLLMAHSVIVALSFFCRRMGAEADYIGLMLMASAGYDPRVAPYVYEYLDCHSSQTHTIFYSTHHSGEERAELLKKRETMALAKQIFEEVKAGKGVRSFI
ncbi:hypothetical protein PTKIN_Ptkin12aG0196000 [Pterospermum kingtungense]